MEYNCSRNVSHCNNDNRKIHCCQVHCVVFVVNAKPKSMWSWSLKWPCWAVNRSRRKETRKKKGWRRPRVPIFPVLVLLDSCSVMFIKWNLVPLSTCPMVASLQDGPRRALPLEAKPMYSSFHLQGYVITYTVISPSPLGGSGGTMYHVGRRGPHYEAPRPPADSHVWR